MPANSLSKAITFPPQNDQLSRFRAAVHLAAELPVLETWKLPDVEGMTRFSVISTAAVMTVAMLLPTPSLAQLNGSHTPIERMNPAIAGKINKVTLEVK